MPNIWVEILKNTGWAGAVIIGIWKVIAPVITYLIQRNKTGSQKNLSDLEEQLHTVETNHLKHVEDDLQDLKKCKSELRSEIQDLRDEFGNRLTRIETKLHMNDK